ncbi:MAG: ester cyclase [Henriciella sp.]|nr:ester cyclase [Henriciella sp.]MBO6695689.1 ester cyclase [Henriciella sp.]
MSTKPITHVATTDITEMMKPGEGRRMDLPGFDAEFVDFPHYIVRITERIWHDRDVEKCLDWYAEDCAIHTMAGDIVGAQTVVQNTWATLKAFPDRRLDADNVIWSDEGDDAFYSSHLITSKMTNEGPSEFGPVTGKQIRVQTIAECLCKDNRVIEEWLVRDNLAAVQQLGFDPDRVAREQAQADKVNSFSLIDFHAANREAVLAGDSVSTDQSDAVGIAANALRASFATPDLDRLRDVYDFRVQAHYPGDVSLYGPDQVQSWCAGLRKAFPDLTVSIDHVADIPYLGTARDVSLRWAATGTHGGAGRYGPPSNAPIYILGVTHFRVMNGRVREQITIWDDIALRRQIASARYQGG